MFATKTVKEQLHEARCENVKLKAALDKTSADVEYIAMMTDVELETEETEDNENEQ